MASLSMDASAKNKQAWCGFRWASNLDELSDAVDEKLPSAEGRTQRTLKYMQKKFRKCPGTLGDEMSLARQLSSAVTNGLNHAPDASLENLMDEIADEYEPVVEGRIEGAAALILAFAAEGNNTVKAEKKLVKAQADLAQGRRPATAYQRLLPLGRALARAEAAVRGVKVIHPPKSCEGRRLKKGEHCEAVISSRATPFNLGEAEIGRNGAGEIASVSVTFLACNGRDVDLELFKFTLNAPFGGTHDISTDAGNGRGSYRRGLGFASSLQTGSEVVVTSVNLAAGYIEGEFSFRSGSVIARDGHFRITSAK
jgi:hypothetical protein